MAPTEMLATAPRIRRPTLAFGPFTFDPDNYLLRRDDEPVNAPPRVLGVLAVLLEHPGDLVSRQDILDGVWKDAFVTDTSLAEAVSALRQTLGDAPQSPTYVQTVHRRGYRFVAPVTVRERPSILPEPSVADAGPLGAAITPSIGRHLVPWSVAVLCSVLAAVAIGRSTLRQDAPLRPGRFSIQLPAGQHFDTRGVAVTLSPDGTQAAWAACADDGCRLYVRPLDQLEPRALSGTEDAASPFYSPDGEWIGFFARGKLRKVPLGTGAPTTIATVADPLGATWTSDGRVIFGSSLTGGLSQVSDNGGAAEPLSLPRQQDGEVRHAWPSVSPDGRTLIFSVAGSLGQDAPVRLVAAALQGRARLTSWTTLLEGAGSGHFLAPDILVVDHGNELQAASFDPVRRTLAGVPQTLVTLVAAVQGRAQFAVASAGSMLSVVQERTAAPESDLGWWRDGSVQPVADLDVAGAPALSADARSIVWTGPGEAGGADLWIGDLDRGAATRLTHGGLNGSPVWAPAGHRVYFARRDKGVFQLAWIDTDHGEPRLIPAGVTGHAFPGSVSAGGRMLAFIVAGQDTRQDLWVIGTGEASTARPVVRSAFDETAPALSADGSLLAYQSDEGGRWDVYVQRIVDGRRAIVSTGGGQHPFWSADGASLLYRSGAMLMQAAISPASLTVGHPAVVADLRGNVPLAVAPDGRVLVNRRTAIGASAILALHWDQEARRLLGPPAARMPR